jgi:hypothetical protein
MGNSEKYLQKSDLYPSVERKYPSQKSIFYGKVVSIEDPTDGGRIKVRIGDIDDPSKIANKDLAYSYPLLPKFFHVYPKIDEIVRIFIQDIKYPQRGRFWLGSIISQPQKIGQDLEYSALSTTNAKRGVSPDKAPSTYPDADGVYPTKEEIAVVGRVNTDIVLRDNHLEFRAGKHENNELLKLNVKNPATFNLTFDLEPDSDDKRYSGAITMADKIGIFSHDGIPKFKSARLTEEDRVKMFSEGHPLGRGDLMVQAMEVFRKAIIAHIHGYSGIVADKNTIINDLEKLNLDAILQKNIVIN